MSDNIAQYTIPVQNPSNKNKNLFQTKGKPVVCFGPISPLADQNDCESSSSSSYIKICNGNSAKTLNVINEKDSKPFDNLTCQSDKESTSSSSFVDITVFDATTRKKLNRSNDYFSFSDTATSTSGTKRKELEWDDQEPDYENARKKEKLLEEEETLVKLALHIADINTFSKDQQYLSDTSTLTGHSYDSDYSSSFVHMNNPNHRRSKDSDAYDSLSSSSTFTSFDESAYSFIKLKKNVKNCDQSITKKFARECSIISLGNIEEASLGAVAGTLEKVTFDERSSSSSLNKKFATYCDIKASSDLEKSSSDSTVCTDDDYSYYSGCLINNSNIKTQHDTEDGEQGYTVSKVEYVMEVAKVNRDEACVALYTTKDDCNAAIMQILSKKVREDSIKKVMEVTALSWEDASITLSDAKGDINNAISQALSSPLLHVIEITNVSWDEASLALNNAQGDPQEAIVQILNQASNFYGPPNYLIKNSMVMCAQHEQPHFVVRPNGILFVTKKSLNNGSTLADYPASREEDVTMNLRGAFLSPMINQRSDTAFSPFERHRTSSSFSDFRAPISNEWNEISVAAVDKGSSYNRASGSFAGLTIETSMENYSDGEWDFSEKILARHIQIEAHQLENERIIAQQTRMKAEQVRMEAQKAKEKIEAKKIYKMKMVEQTKQMHKARIRAKLEAERQQKEQKVSKIAMKRRAVEAERIRMQSHMEEVLRLDEEKVKKIKEERQR